MSRIKYFNTETQSWEKADIAGKESKTTNIVYNFYGAEAKGKYDLKDGYATTPDIYIAADGTETTKAGLSYATTDYIPVEANVPYTTFGVGYALYKEDKTFISSTFDVTNSNGKIREFTPTENGFVPEDIFLQRLPEIAKNAVADACTGSNPRKISVPEMEKLLKCCYYDTEVDF